MSFLTDDEKRIAAGYLPLGEGALGKHRPFELGAKYRLDQPRVAAGNPDGGQWTDAGGGGGVLVGGSGKDKLANPRAHIGGNGPPPESGTLLGRVGAIVGR